jgi:hypothetical protein
MRILGPGDELVDIRRRFWPLFAACLLAAAVILILLPAEKTLGQVIKIVYLHGALSRAGMVGFILAAIAGLAYLVARRPALIHWSQGLMWSGWAFWAVHFIVSMPATRLTWGPWIAWGEPRVVMTLQVLVAGLVVILVSWLLQNSYFTAAANLLFGGAFLLLAVNTGVLRHPLDPIGTSPSLEFRLVYAGLLVPVIGAMLLVAWRWATPAPTAVVQAEPIEARGGTQ